MTLSDWLAAVEARRTRCADVLDVGGTEQALIGGDIDILLAMLRRAVKGLESIAANTCCDRCQEAALVAQTTLGKLNARSDGKTWGQGDGRS